MAILGMISTFLLFVSVACRGYKAYVKINFELGTRDKQINSFITTSVLVVSLLVIVVEVLLFKLLELGVV